MTLITEVVLTCEHIQSPRTAADILLHAVTEIGELALEIQIDEGKSYKQTGDDGIVGEALDVIVCMIDIIYNQMGQFFEEEQLVDWVRPKLEKWKSKQMLVNSRNMQ